MNTAVALGCAVSIFGVQMMQNDAAGNPQAWSVWLGIALSIAAIVASIPLKRGVLLGLGAVGVVLFAFPLVQTLFEGQIAAPIVLLVMGVVFIAMAVLVAMVLPRLRGQSPN